MKLAAVIVPVARTPSVRPPPGATNPNRNTTMGPFTPAGARWMCDWTTLWMLLEMRRYSSAVPSLVSCSFTSPTPRLSRAGTSLAPVRWATKFFASGTSAFAFAASGAVTLRCAVGTVRSVGSHARFAARARMVQLMMEERIRPPGGILTSILSRPGGGASAHHQQRRASADSSGALYNARRRAAPLGALCGTALAQHGDQAVGLLGVELERPGLLDHLVERSEERR